MNAYELKISTSFGEVRVESYNFSYLKDVKEALDSVQEKADKQQKEEVKHLVNSMFDAEVKKQPAKKRGRPVGSTSKTRKVK
jgi:hypothetical protein